MSIKGSIVQRLMAVSRTTSRQRHYTMNRPNLGPNRSAMEHDPGDNNTLARAFPQLLGLPGGTNSSYRVDLGRNFPIWSSLPPPSPSPTSDDARKLLRVAQMEMAKARLRETPEVWMEHEKFVRVCGCGFSDPDRGVRVAKMLDESGHVVVLGDHVLLRPELVRKAIEGFMPTHNSTGRNDTTMKELEAMEKERAAIDATAVAQVKRELWCGLGFLVAQTAAFMRLTFWELTWDVMEPICFFLTSTYFMAGYTFFLRTSREPTFEGFFQSRVATKRKRIMDARGFDLGRYEELLMVCSTEDSKLKSFCK